MDRKIINLNRYYFLFKELTKRDFKKKYKRTVLGIGWSVLSPLLSLLVMKVVFSYYFGRGIAHYTTFLFCGNLVYSYYREATNGGMSSLMSNASIFTKINVPKYIFLLTKNVSAAINFLLTLCVFFIFVFFDDINFGIHFIYLIFPVTCLVIFNIGIGMILSALYVFYRDIGYLYDVFTLLLMYCSAIFYNVDILPEKYQSFFLLNPIYTYINYFRAIVLKGSIPSIEYHLLCAFYALISVVIGSWIYKKYNHKFLYYV